MTTNLWTTGLGFLAGVVNYLVTVGAQMPTNRNEWGNLLLSAVFAGLGYKAADTVK